MLNHKMSVAVLGASNGGLALAGYLSKLGHVVALWNRSPERVAAVAQKGGIDLTCPGAVATHVPIALATSDIAAALADVQVVLVAVPACAHADIARQCAPHLRHGQTVLLLPGRTGGALEFRRALRDAGCYARILLGEANTFPFASRCVEPGAAVIYGVKTELLAAALPANQTRHLIAACRPFLPMLRPAPSALHTGLANLGAILHPVITLLNADRIEKGESFDFYREGVTPAVASALAAADAERLRIARAYKVPACSLRDWIARAYDHHAETIHAAVTGNPAYVGIKAPTTLRHRYLLEDVPTGLIPLLELGKAARQYLPELSALVDQSRMVLGKHGWQQPRTLDVLGLEGLNAESIRAYVEQGRYPALHADRLPLGSFASSLQLVPQL
ncbi:MAG TPA: NAD/NADP octopine/nopaline dehydrogenase family protein [Gemmataceae bacterium]